MAKKISFTISDELYDILKDAANDHGIPISAFLRDILEDKYRDLLIDDDLPPSLKTRQEYFRNHLEMIVLYSIIKNMNDGNNNIPLITLKKDKLKKQYDISDNEATIFFSTSATGSFYNPKTYSRYTINPIIHETKDEMTMHLSSEYVEIIRDFLKNGDFPAAISRF